MKAKVAYSYGWTDEYINSMALSVFIDYWLALDAIENSFVLNNIMASSFPHSKKPYQSKTVNKLKKVIRSTVRKEKKGIKSIEDVNKSIEDQILKGMRNG